MNKVVVWALIGLGSFIAEGQSIVGKWKTVDDVSGTPRSVVEIYQKGNEYFGKVLKIYPKPEEDPDPVCDECEGEKKNKKIIGMEIIERMRFDPEEKVYVDGQILDPENGSVYDCRMWIEEDGNLRVRGYLFFLYRTQIWLPFNE